MQAAGALAVASSPKIAESLAYDQLSSAFQLKYIVSSCLYGYTDIETILGEVPKCGSTAIDIWPKVHGDQREQVERIGREKFAEMLDRSKIQLGCITQYKLGPFGLQEEMRFAQSLDCKTIVTGAVGPAGLQGTELKQAVRDFIEKMKPHLAVAEETGVNIAIENHANNLIHSAESMQYLFELRPNHHLSIAFAPYHLPQDGELQSRLLQDILPGVAVFYAWQHGDGSSQPQPKERELLQLPGRGKFDFQPILQVLKRGGYQGWTSIFMHPFPRGIAILEPTDAVTAEVQRARTYLDDLLNTH
jgi:sugar phosphate isomerase/epimerase